MSFWNNHAHDSLGYYVNEAIGFAGILPPSIFSLAQITAMSDPNSTKSVWAQDKLPSRLDSFYTALNSKHSSGKPLVIVVHCEAGCDRTGQWVGSYRMRYNKASVTDMYALDTAECGRSPNYFGTSGLEWFCYYLSMHVGIIPGNCTGVAKCKPFGKC